ncbi:MAG: peptidylprolyl isomerase [Chitinophagales bacterium]
MKKIIAFYSFLLLTVVAFAADSTGRVLLDKIDAIVNDQIILSSDIENQLDLLNLRGEDEKESRCQLMEQMIYNKMLTTQAMSDSLPVTNEEVENELDRKINYFISIAGSQEAFEEYYHKTVDQIKADYRDDIREQMLASRMREKITGDINITPSEVKSFYEKIPKDSLPYFNATVEIQQIVMKPHVSAEQNKAARDKAEEILARLRKGESFDLLASLYSQDLGSAQQGGLLDWAPRGTYVKEFEGAAFKLKNGEISDVVETPFGFHIIQMVERRGDMIQVKHILIRPITTSNDAYYAQSKLDSVRNDIISGKITFFDAVKNYSQDEQSKNVGGFMLNSETGGTVLDVNNLESDIYQIVDTLKVDSITKPVMFMDFDGTPAYRIIKLVSRTAPHVADIKIDYDRLQNAAKKNKEDGVLQDWYDKNKRKTYIMISDEYKDCDALQSLLPK